MKFLIKHRRLLVLIGWLFCGSIAVLQYFKINLGVITNYGADLFAPVMLYYYIRRTNRFVIKLPFKPTKVQVSLGLLGLCILWEIRQYLNPGTGTFDVLDIIVYCLAIFLCYFMDVSLEKHLTSTEHNIG